MAAWTQGRPVLNAQGLAALTSRSSCTINSNCSTDTRPARCWPEGTPSPPTTSSRRGFGPLNAGPCHTLLQRTGPWTGTWVALPEIIQVQCARISICWGTSKCYKLTETDYNILTPQRVTVRFIPLHLASSAGQHLTQLIWKKRAMANTVE